MADGNMQSDRFTSRVNSRNLRAKVKSILPLKICCKYDQRNTRLKQLEHLKNREEDRIKTTKLQMPWNNSQGSLNQFFYDKFKKTEPKHMFAKLDKAEIDQICDHKHYFLGDNHLDDFETFLNPKPTNESSVAVMKTERTYRSSQEKPHTIMSTLRSREFTSLKNWDSTQLRIKDIREEDNSNRETRKLIIDLKQRRAENNVGLQNETRQTEITNRQERRRTLQNKINNFKSAQKQDRQIGHMVDQLRNICCFKKQ